MGRAPQTQRDSDERRRGRGLLRGVWVVGVYLCWGLVLTWAVAWGVAWAGPSEEDGWDLVLVESEQQESSIAVMYSGFGKTAIAIAGLEEGIAWSFDEPWPLKRSELPWFAERAVPLWNDVPVTGPWSVAAYGWPRRALAFELWAESIPTNLHRGRFSYDEDRYGAVAVPGGRLRGRARFSGNDLWLPLLPLWRGLIANVLFYALLVWGLRRGFVLLRGRRRRRRGRCWVRGGCGYDLTGLDSATCPECGRPVASAPEPDAPARSQLP